MMNRRSTISGVCAVLFFAAIAAPAAEVAKPSLHQRTSQQTYAEIRQMLGSVPSFFKLYPEHSISGAWEEFKQLSLNPKTALPGEVKELIGVAVAAQIPCSYCSYAHEKFGKLNGSNDLKVREAIGVASNVRHWSTLMNGSGIDQASFQKDIDRMYSQANKKQQAGTIEASAIDSAQDPSGWAMQDIQQTLGFVPEFFRKLPKDAQAGAWLDMKSFEMAETAISAKHKELIGLAVAGQVPCTYCVYAHTKGARAKGASDQEIQEAISLASLTRKWSTVLNGNRVNESQFRSEIDQIVSFARQQMSNKKKQLGGEAASEYVEPSAQ
jgi:AhpD family alkylhydroperoxidase